MSYLVSLRSSSPKWWMQVSQKIFMSYPRIHDQKPLVAWAILALAAEFANYYRGANAGFFLIEPSCFRSCFVMLYLNGFDLLTGVFVLTPLALNR